jgi:hypothetical protein
MREDWESPLLRGCEVGKARASDRGGLSGAETMKSSPAQNDLDEPLRADRRFARERRVVSIMSGGGVDDSIEKGGEEFGKAERGLGRAVPAVGAWQRQKV